MIQKIFSESLPLKTAQLVKLLQEKRPSFLNHFYLSGGTALALQLNHRESIDLDFFSPQDFDPIQIQSQLEVFGKLSSLEVSENTLNTFLKGAQLQFLGYPYPLLKPAIDWQGIKVSSIIDIACTKLQTISQRGSKKDFIDFYFLLQSHSLEELFKQMAKKYKGADYNEVHLLKSLSYFADADLQPMPKMRQKVSWEEIKKEVTNKVKELST